MRHAGAIQHGAQSLVLFNRNGADQHRLALGVEGFYLAGDGIELGFFGAVNTVRPVNTGQRAVGRHFHHIELVNLVEFLGFGQGRAGHAGQLFI